MNNPEILEKLIGKTIAKVEQSYEGFTINGHYYGDDCTIVTFTDRSIWKLASWDYEGYASGIAIDFIEEK